MTEHAADAATVVTTNLPYLRRYARALTGSQDTGDRFAAATLEAILEDDAMLAGPLPPRIALFRAFHLVWSSAGAPLGTPDSDMSRRAQDHMATLTPNTREALLLHAIEGFSTDEVGQIMDLPGDQADTLIQIAKQEMADSVAGSVLIIEDEAIIAMDIQMIVSEIGHRVTGIARTRSAAVELAARDRPDLILADIQLADQSSGIDAVGTPAYGDQTRTGVPDRETLFRSAGQFCRQPSDVLCVDRSACLIGATTPEGLQSPPALWLHATGGRAQATR